MSVSQDLAVAVSDLADAVAVEIDTLKKALSFVGEDAAISASVQKLNELTKSLKDSVVPATPAPDPVPVPAA